jgi:hypothetical protein
MEVGSIRISTELFGVDQVRSVVENILEKIGVEWTIYKLGMILDHMGQGQINISLLEETFANWTEFNYMGLFLIFGIMGQAHNCLLNWILSSVAKLFHNQVEGLIIMKLLQACGHVWVISTLVDPYSKLCDHVGGVSALVDTYSKLACLGFALEVFTKWEFIGEFTVMNAHYQFSKDITIVPSYTHKDGTNDTTLLCVLCSFAVSFFSKTFGATSRSVLYREDVNHKVKYNVFRLCTDLQQAMNGEHNWSVAFERKAHIGLCLKFKSYFSWCDSLANESAVSLIYWLMQESSTCWKYTLMPTVTVAIMMPIPEALDYVFRKQVSFFNKDNGMQLRGQVNNNVSFYVLPISAVYSGWQTLNFWILKIEEGKLNSLSIKVMKFILLVINGKYREKEIASSLLLVHTEISSMESITSSFVIWLENAIANVIVKLLVKSNCIMLPNDVYP